MATEVVTLEGGDRIRTHTSDVCRPPCCIHHRTNHSMRHFPQQYRWDSGLMERICPHGIGHPDPDDYAIVHGDGSMGVHGCDGCCRNRREPIRVIASIGIPLESGSKGPQER